MILIILFLLLAIILFAVIQYSFLVPPVKGLPVLMYHLIDETLPPDGMNVTPAQFSEQLNYLKRNNYSTILFSELLDYVEKGTSLPANPILLTFDDGYKNNFTQMYPLLKQNNFKANIFLVSNFIDKKPSIEDRNEYLTTSDLRAMDPSVIEFGLHTYDHTDYNNMEGNDIDNDLKKCINQFKELGITCQPCFAYTYGSYPKKDMERRNKLFELLKSNDISLAFRIGNRVNRFPIQNKLLIKRIDIKGTDSFSRFKTKVKKGRVKLFG